MTFYVMLFHVRARSVILFNYIVCGWAMVIQCHCIVLHVCYLVGVYSYVGMCAYSCVVYCIVSYVIAGMCVLFYSVRWLYYML